MLVHRLLLAGARLSRLHVITRVATCIAPAHQHPARDAELDHGPAFGRTTDDGRTGTTSPSGLGAVCKRGHNSHTHGGWDGTQPRPGVFTWTGPTGRSYTRRPRPLLPQEPDTDDDDPG